MQSEKNIENILNNIINWTFVSNKKKIVKHLAGYLKKDEVIIDLLEGMYTGKNIQDPAFSIYGVIFLTSNRLIFISGEKKDSFHEIIFFENILSINFAHGFSHVELIISGNRFTINFKSYTKSKAVRKFVEEIHLQSNDEIIEYEAEELEIKGTERNVDFLFLEAKKIYIALKLYIELQKNDSLTKFIIDDILLIGSFCISGNEDIKTNEKFFLTLILSAILQDIPVSQKSDIIMYFKNSSFKGDYNKLTGVYWEEVAKNLNLKTNNLDDIRFLSIEYLKKVDNKLGTTHYDRLRTIFYNFSQCIIKADGIVKDIEVKKSKKICSLIYAKNPFEENKKHEEIDIKENIKNGSTKENEEELSLEDVLEDINKLIGMKNIKDQINTLINLIKVQKARKEKGLPVSNISLHSVFYGPPGTGKTTIARLLGKVYKCLGLLQKGQLIETDRAGLVAGYVGQTAIKVDEIINKALDGILFIDEAYTLKPADSSKDFGQEAIDIILKRMEDHRERLVIIVAGYPDEMKAFINSNPGLKSRFNRYFYFDHFKPEELLQIFDIFSKNVKFNVSEDARNKILKLLTVFYDLRDKRFGNGRLVRNIFEKIIEKQADRISNISPLTEEILSTITVDDIPESKDIVS